MEHPGPTKKGQNYSTRMAGFSKRVLIVVLGGIVVLLVIGSIVVYFVLKSSTDPSDGNGTDINDDPPTSIRTPLVVQTVNDANKTPGTGDTKAGVAIYEKAISSTDDLDEKAALLVKQAEFLSTRRDNKAAIAAALKAQEMSGETLETTAMLALLYEMTGDKANAAVYFRKAADRVLIEMVKDELYDPEAEAAYYREKADQLEAR